MHNPLFSVSGLAVRSALGGVLMGLANLVPGISGGTMLLAAGIYPQFINAIAEVTTFKFRTRSLVVLGAVVVAAACAILFLAGAVKDLVVHQRWIMYSIFIGLTLGGVPVVWKMARPAGRSTWLGALAGFVAMTLLAIAQQRGLTGDGHSGGVVMMFLAGVAGASAMILPGVSGGYLLLVLGVYVPLLAAIDLFKTALSPLDLPVVLEVGLQVILPVGAGVVVGVVAVSNVLKVLLERCRNATLGFLLGLLLGAVVGLWPFQEAVAPELGSTLKGRVVTEANLDEFDPEDYPTAFFKPTGKHVAGALALILGGFFCTVAISRFGGREER